MNAGGQAFDGRFDAVTQRILPSSEVTHVHLLRHGAVQGMSQRIVRGQLDEPLSDEGRGETRALVARGLEAPLRALRAIGYDEAIALVAGEIEQAEAEARTNRRTGQMAKRQRTWFRHQVEAVRLDVEAMPFEDLLSRTLEVARG